MKLFTAVIPMLLFTCALFAQESNTLEAQFEETIDKSNNYQEFKVIEKRKLAILRKNILDSVTNLETEIKTLNTQIDTQKGEITSLTNNLSKANEDLTVSISKEDGIKVLGMQTKKTTYNTIMWSIIGVLLALLGFFVFKFKNSNAVTRDAKMRLEEIETEFEEHRQKKLEEIQQIKRKLQDELNKNKKV